MSRNADYPILVDGSGRQFVKVPVEDFVQMEVRLARITDEADAWLDQADAVEQDTVSKVPGVRKRLAAHTLRTCANRLRSILDNLATAAVDEEERK